MMKLSFTLRVLAISFIVLALPLLIDSFIFFQTSYFHSIQEAKGKLKELANFKKFTFLELQPANQVLLKEMIYLLDLEKKLDDISSSDLDRELAITAHRLQDFQIFLLKKVSNEDFKVVASSLTEFYNTQFRSYVILNTILSSGFGSFARYVYSPVSKKYIPFLFAARVVTSSQGEDFILVVATELTFEFQSILTKSDENKDIDFAILSVDGVVLDSTNPSLKGQYFDTLSPERKREMEETDVLGSIKLAESELVVLKDKEFPFFEFIFDDQVQIAYRSFVSEQGISIVSFASKQDFFGQAVTHFLVIYAIYGLVLVVGGGITYWISLWVSRPLRQLNFLMSEAGKGNFDARFKKEPLGFEINLLGEMFNQTLDALLENMQRVEDERVKKEIYEKELYIGMQVQKNLLPTEVPIIEGAEVAGTYVPVKEAGGDFYDFFSRKLANGEEALYFGVTDAAGKGIPSCLFAVSFRSLLMSYTNIQDDIGMALSKTNNNFLDDASSSSMFIKALHGVFHPSTKMLYYYSCGNIPGLVKKASGEIITLEHAGIAIGLKESSGYKTDEMQLQTGDFVLFFSDGLVEVVNEKNHYFSTKRLESFLREKNWNTAQEALDAIIKEVSNFVGATPQEQEITLVVLKVM